MLVEVIATVDEVKHESLFKKTIIVVDILRTSTTIITALENGGNRIIPVETIGQAKLLKNTENDLILAGDRFSKRIQEFNLGNSPTEFISSNIKDKTIVLTTSNGTRAIQKAAKGENILIGGFLNGESCMRHAVKLKRDIVILCVGNRNEFALEDGLAAGFLIDMLMTVRDPSNEVDINDFGKAMYGLYKFHENNLTDIIKSTETAKRLIQLGFADDIKFSVFINQYTVCPTYDSTLNIIKPSSN